MIDFPFNISRVSVLPGRKDDSQMGPRQFSLEETFNRVLLDQYTPASILINEKGDILYINGKIGRYIEINSGEPNMNIHRVVREELKYGLGNAIRQSVTQKRDTVINGMRIKLNNLDHLVNIRVNYLDNSALSVLYLLFLKIPAHIMVKRLR